MERGQNLVKKIPYRDNEVGKATFTEPSASFESKNIPTAKFVGVCEQLDSKMDSELFDRAWKQFDTVGQQCLLEGNEYGWIACSIYLSMWQSAPLGQQLLHRYPLSKLLNICKISALEFFDKLSKWVEMVSCPRRLQEQVSRIQSCLAVSSVVYKKYLPIFRTVFEPPGVLDPDAQNECKLLFQLIWTMFIAMRKQLTTDDLLNNFDLLLCIVDFAFQDLRTTGNGQLINKNFVESFVGEEESVLETLCRNFQGVVLDAKHFRAHWFLPKLRNMINEKKISITQDFIMFYINGITNLKMLSEQYEDAMMKKGEMDERMFIPSNIAIVFDEAFDASVVEQLRRSDLDGDWTVDAELLLRMSTQSCLEKLQEQRTQQTPLSGKSYVISGDQPCPLTPVGLSAYKAAKLEYLIRQPWQMMGSELERIMSLCRENPAAFVADCVRLMGDKMENAVATEREVCEAFDAAFSELIAARRSDIEILFYRFLDRVARAEKTRMPPSELQDLSAVLNKEEVLTSIYACALETVLFSYDSVREFPWSVEMLHIAPVFFYRVIELVIRAEPELTRGMVKHFNKIEERVLEELAWSLDSPLWQTLARRADGVPSSQSVSLNSMEAYSSRTQAMYGGLSQRFVSTPLKMPYGVEPAKRRLDFDAEDMLGPGPAKRPAFDTDYPATTSATTLFFRKVYYLAAVRLQDLCERVRMDERGRQRVWTLFEHVLRTETSLMAGRHLDQNLMCCLYVVAKIAKQDVSFHDIMFHYRRQPQATSRVYRRVLIDHNTSPTVMSDDNASRDSIGSNSGGKFRSGSTLPVPGMGSAPPTPEPQNLDFSDLIKYYNRVFVSRVEYFVKKLQPGLVDLKETGISLLSMPTVRSHTLSPRRAINEHVCVLPMPTFPPSPGRPLRYCFNRTPSKELKAINTMVQGASRPLGYSLNSYPSSSYRPSPYAARTS